ncbi:hypothetical protein EXIGLDRAFT_822721 [Exidia glandulosa HHB12029]|uniref:Glycosyltransferase family 8 protein n=1 Tax=Exidia glandulosa HHB12029 TaxID=1314781 RepID=A0A165JCN4_EXIGL|nr:hypothetical protein EXIGLDRAFT_822721 [Exidia glandulosa HHB12029]
MSNDAHSQSRIRKILGILALLALFLLLNLVILHVPSTIADYELPFPSFLTSKSTQHAPSADEGPIVFAMVMFGARSAQEGQHMLKSVLMRASRAVEVHIVCSEDAIPVLDAKLALVKKPVHGVDVRFYPVTSDVILARAKRAGIGSKHHAGAGGLAKMFIHELVPAQRAIYIDTDAVFVTDPSLLWTHFLSSHISSTSTLIALTHGGVHAQGTDLCTCVMGLHLGRMRGSPLLPSTLLPGTDVRALGRKEVWQAARIDEFNPPWGDQGLYWAMFHSTPGVFGRLSRRWDLNACHGHYGLNMLASDTTPDKFMRLGNDTADVDETDGILAPGIVHFNCQDSEDSVFENARVRGSPVWGPLVTYTTQYKWAWLNQGDGSESVVTSTIRFAGFYDERVAAEWSQKKAGHQ